MLWYSGPVVVLLLSLAMSPLGILGIRIVFAHLFLLAICALLADGWSSGFVGFDAKRAGAHYGTAPELLAQLVIDFADGTDQWVVTDDRWRGRFGAIRHADLLMGERHDLSLEPVGWDAAGFDAAGWRGVRFRERDSRRLVADPGPPVRVTEEISPQSIERDADGRHIVDFGQNLPGWLKIRVDGATGHSVRHGEVLAEDGSLYTENLRTARQTDEYAGFGGAATLETGSPCTGSASRRSPASPAPVTSRRAWPTPMFRPPGRSSAPNHGSTSCFPPSTGVSAATSSASRPTARNATSGWAGSATPRSSPGRPATTGTSRPSSTSGSTTWPMHSSPPAPSPTSRPALPLSTGRRTGLG